MEVKILGVQLLRKRSDQGDPISASTERKLSTTIIMSNSWKASLQQDDRAWSSQEWKTDTEMKLLGERHEKFDLVSLTRKPFMMEPRNPL